MKVPEKTHEEQNLRVLSRTYVGWFEQIKPLMLLFCSSHQKLHHLFLIILVCTEDYVVK